MKKYTANDVAKWFLSKSPMSNKKLQKLVYYAYAWTLTLLNESAENLYYKLFDEHIEAWVHGAVIKNLYFEYAHYGWYDIPSVKPETSVIINDTDNSDIKDILEQVWSTYGSYSANDLESINHQETPWINARKGLAPYQSGHRIISDVDIFNYYNEL